MGDVRGFMKYRPQLRSQRAGRRAAEALQRVPQDPAGRRTADARARAAWTAAFRFATPAARWETSFPTGTIWCIATTGAKRSIGCTPRTTFPSSPAASAPRRAKRPACWASTKIRWRSSRSKCRSPIAASTKAGSCPSRRTMRTGKKVAVIGSGPAGLGRRAATQSGRASGHRVRAGRSARRPVDVRHSRFQAGKIARLAADRADARPKGSSFARNANVGVNVADRRVAPRLRRACC